jgi:hypothetical protein
VSFVPLSNEKTRVIFAASSLSGLAKLDGRKQKGVLRCLISVIESESKPRQLAHEEIKNLDIFTVGSTARIYTKIVENIPRGNKKYHLIYVFYIDDQHDYEQSDLFKYSQRADTKANEATSLSDVSDVEEYLKRQDARTAEDLRSLLN